MTATKMVTSYNLGCLTMSPCLANELSSRSPERERILEYQDGQSQQKDLHEGGKMVKQGKARRWWKLKSKSQRDTKLTVA